jgi:hypothetical protein
MLKLPSFFQKKRKPVFRGPPPLTRKFQMPDVKEMEHVEKNEEQKPGKDEDIDKNEAGD